MRAREVAKTPRIALAEVSTLHNICYRTLHRPHCSAYPCNAHPADIIYDASNVPWIDDFFDLRTRIAAEIAQKFIMYGRRVAIVGDISARTAESKSLAAFIVEANRGRDLWFVGSIEELAHRLAR